MKSDFFVSLRKIKFLMILIIVAFLPLVFTSCMWRISFDSLTGSGNVVTEDREVKDFNAVEITGIGKLTIKQGSKESLKLEGEDNILKNIRTEVSNNTLKIEFKSGLNIIPTKDLLFYLTVKDLTSIISSGAAAVNGEGLNLKEISIKLNGAEKIVMSGTVNKQEITINGAGYYDAKDFASKESRVSLNGAGGVTVKVSDTLNATISGAGSIKYIGNPEVIEKINGVGKIEKIGD